MNNLGVGWDNSGSSYLQSYQIYQGTGTVFDPYKFPVLELEVKDHMNTNPEIILLTFKCAYCQHQITIIDKKIPDNCPGCGARVFSLIKKESL